MLCAVVVSITGTKYLFLNHHGSGDMTVYSSVYTGVLTQIRPRFALGVNGATIRVALYTHIY